MKKALLLSVLALGAMFANAQAIQQPGFFRNWSIGVDGGVSTPLHHESFFRAMRGNFGLNVKKTDHSHFRSWSRGLCRYQYFLLEGYGSQHHSYR